MTTKELTDAADVLVSVASTLEPERKLCKEEHSALRALLAEVIWRHGNAKLNKRLTELKKAK